MKIPVVSIVMAVYNGDAFLAEAVDSILSQTYRDFEFIIIDDGSSDSTPAMLKKYAEKDKRIKVFKQKNQGLVASLNRGILAAQGEYIARQDADDASMPGRLEKQLDFMRRDRDIVALGSSIEVMDDEGKKLHRHAVLLNDNELKQELLLRSPFAHGSVIFRREEAVKAGLYQQDSWPAEDYDFWLRLSRLGKFANLDEYLYIYREHAAGISQRNRELQEKKVAEIRLKAWRQRSRLVPKRPIDLDFYSPKDMGQLRIERLVDNGLFISRQAWRYHDRSLAFGSALKLARRKTSYKKAAGKLKRRIKP